MSTMTMSGALNAGLRAALTADPKVVLMGEDIGALGGVLTDERRAAATAHATEVAHEMRTACTGLTDPDPMSLFEHVYTTEHPGIERQKARYARYLDSFEDAR